jgi:hypothetical protein
LFSILTDIRYSARKFARAPSLSVTLLLTIALGTGSNVSVRRFVLGLTNPGAPLASTDRVVSVFGQDAHREAGPLSNQDYQLLPTSGFEWIGAARILPGTIAWDGQSAIMSVAAVTPRLAAELNLSLDQGIVISHRMWRTEFRAKADVRGEHLRIEGVDVRVGGIGSMRVYDSTGPNLARALRMCVASPTATIWAVSGRKYFWATLCTSVAATAPIFAGYRSQ